MALYLNMIDWEAYVPSMVEDRVMPVLQDDDSTQAMRTRGISKDDLLIIDRSGKRWKQLPMVFSYNLTTPHVLDTLEAWLRRIP